MKRLLAIALLAASSAHADNYLCTYEYGSLYARIDGKDKPQHFELTKSPRFVIKSTDDETVFGIQNVNGTYPKTCYVNLTATLFNDQNLVCDSSDGRIVLNYETGRYIQTMITIDENFKESMSSIHFGNCEKFKL